MGMDVFGRNPSSKAGEYFRANVWSWRPIHDLVIRLCSDFLDEGTLESLGYNDGSGPEDQETCTQIANRFELWMEHNVEGHDIDIEGMQEMPEVLLISELQGFETSELETPYGTDDEHLKE